ncbi:MFS transporter [Opitutaceae bacterium TAV4]|nr:MFS transporter [Opitutaceae bacterium TAV4]RRK00120.1 MFS transporter [Opitutaceae bacterium TAV3]RRK00353.1 MFS transporter [Opitutaceae bacterium TAV3]
MSKKLFHKVQPTAPEDKVSVPKRFAFGIGNFTDHMGTDTLMGNANPIFNITLHMDPRLLGVALAIIRLWDAITDPIVGALSDNARTRWGRRRPFMFFGAISAGLTFPLIWFVPGGLSSFNVFLWFTIFAILFFTCQTFFTVPWHALGSELTPDYNERTRLMEMRAYMGKAVGIICPWTYAFTQLPIWGGNTMVGARWMGVIIGIILIISGLLPVIFLAERFYKKAGQQQKISILRSIGMTLKNGPFMMMVAITFFNTLGGRTVNHLGFYIGLYYLFGGDKMKQGILAGVGGNVAFVIGLCSVFLLNRLSLRIGKRKTLAVCLILLILSGLAKWLFYVPGNPWLSLIVLLFTVPSVTGFWLLITSINADICDHDELTTGLRREGAISAVFSWISKLSISATAVLAGFVLAVTGYQSASGAEQSAGVIDAMRWWFYIIPSASAVIALALLWWFPITEARAREIRRILEERRGKL